MTSAFENGSRWNRCAELRGDGKLDCYTALVTNHRAFVTQSWTTDSAIQALADLGLARSCGPEWLGHSRSLIRRLGRVRGSRTLRPQPEPAARCADLGAAEPGRDRATCAGRRGVPAVGTALPRADHAEPLRGVARLRSQGVVADHRASAAASRLPLRAAVSEGVETCTVDGVPARATQTSGCSVALRRDGPDDTGNPPVSGSHRVTAGSCYGCWTRLPAM